MLLISLYLLQRFFFLFRLLLRFYSETNICSESTVKFSGVQMICSYFSWRLSSVSLFRKSCLIYDSKLHPVGRLQF